MPDHPKNPAARAACVKAEARALGFDDCRIARAGEADPENRLGAWLEKGYHADMDWLERSKALRQDPRRRLPDARSVVVVTRNYRAPRPAPPPRSGKVSCYAWGRDYHRVMRKPLLRLARFSDQMAPGARSFVSVDSGPVMERVWAQRAGIGWVGHHSLVLSRQAGSWFFLGVLVTTLELEPDAPVTPHCGSCRACADACPTGAIVADGVVDSRRCISYHTIENRNGIPPEVSRRMEGWVFGCDICQEVCPWNGGVPETGDPAFHPKPGHAHLDLAGLLAMDEAEFFRRFEGSPIRRAKLSGMQRNARILVEEAPGPEEAGGV